MVTEKKKSNKKKKVNDQITDAVTAAPIVYPIIRPGKHLTVIEHSPGVYEMVYDDEVLLEEIRALAK